MAAQKQATARANEMRLIDIVSGPWAITPEIYSEIQDGYSRHMRGEKIDVKGIEARVGTPMNPVLGDYSIANGVAVISLDGPLAKRMNLLMQVCGGTSTEIAGQQIQEALDDPSVSAIVLAIDSPGGTVDGTQALANLVYSARDTKPIITVGDGVMASAAMWIGSAASKVFIANDTTMVGSIGVVMAHVDVSGAEAQRGVKTTEITAGKYKRVASQYGALSEDGRADIQSKVDYIYSVFVDDVARNRGVDAETVLKNMADGRVFIGRQAVDAGLVDGVATLEEIVARAAAGEFALTPGNQARAETSSGDVDAVANPNHEVQVMDIEKLKAEHPALAQALYDEGFKAGEAKGAENERTRIKDVEAQALPGHDKLIAELKFDGKSTGGDAAVAILAAEKKKRGDKLAALEEDASAATTTAAAAPVVEKKDDQKAGVDAFDVSQKAQAYIAEQAAKGITVDAATAVAHVMKEGKSNG
jgi:signal peptide peptidase SppA